MHANQLENGTHKLEANHRWKMRIYGTWFKDIAYQPDWTGISEKSQASKCSAGSKMMERSRKSVGEYTDGKEVKHQAILPL